MNSNQQSMRTHHFLVGIKLFSAGPDHHSQQESKGHLSSKPHCHLKSLFTGSHFHCNPHPKLNQHASSALTIEKLLSPTTITNSSKNKSTMLNRRSPLAKSDQKIKPLTIIDGLPRKGMEKILATPNAPMPWKWHQQCFNDRVTSCSPFISLINRDINSAPASLLKSHYANNYIKLEQAGQKTLSMIMRILADIKQDDYNDKQQQIPYHHYEALEILLGLGFTPSYETDIQKRTVNILMFVTPKGQLLKHLGPISRLGLYRLVGAILDFESIRFTIDDAEYRNLLLESKDQPLALAQILKRTTDPSLCTKIAHDCPQCNNLAKAIHQTLLIKSPTLMVPLCNPDGGHPIVTAHSGLLSMAKTMPRRDQLVLARILLWIAFNVPFSSTSCPNCSNFSKVPKADLVIFSNAMLECYCQPRSKFHLVD